MKRIFYTIIFLFLLLLIIVPNVNASVNLTDGLVTYLTLDETSGTTAVDSVGDYNFTATNSAVFTGNASGIINTSADFGTGVYTIGNTNVPISTGYITWSIWINQSSWGTAHQTYVFQNSVSNNNRMIYSISSIMYFCTRTSSGSQKCVGEPTSSFNTNEWYHFVAIENTTGIFLYVNGVLNQSLVESWTKRTFYNELYLGGYGSGSAYSNARQDEFALYNRSLSSTEIEELYELGIDGLQYPFSSPTPSNETNMSFTAKDSITNGAITNFSILLTGQKNNTDTAFYSFENSLDEWNEGGTGSLTYSTTWKTWGDYSLLLIPTGINMKYVNLTISNYSILNLDYNILIDEGGTFEVREGSQTGTILYSDSGVGERKNINISVTPNTNIFIIGNGQRVYVDNLRFNFIRFTDSTTNGTINTGVLWNPSYLYNITYESNEQGGYYNSEYTGLNLTPYGNHQGALNPYFYLYGVEYSNYTTESGNDYVRVLSYTYNYTCPSQIPTYRNLYIDDVLESSTLLTCNNLTNSIIRTYENPTEGLFDIKLGLYVNNTFDENTTNTTFISDLLPPVISGFSFSIPTGFNLTTYNITLQCYDTIYSTLEYNLTRDGTILYNNSLSNDTLHIVTSSAVDGINPHTFRCSDAFDNTSSTLTPTLHYKNISIINEKTGNLFDITNLTDARIVFESPAYNTSINLKSTNTSIVTLLTNTTRNFRVELEYTGGEVVTRDLNTFLVDSQVPVCANTNPTTHTEQFIISVTQKPAIVRSNLHNCYVLADYTRFAYQSSFMAKYYTISTYYFLNTKENGEESLLASIEGATGTTINLDTLSFGSTLFDVSLRDSQVMIKKHPTSNQTLIIYFYNSQEDNVALDIDIYYNNSLYFSTSTTTSPNNITINFDYTTLSMGNNPVFKLVFTEEKEDGDTNIITTYYSTTGSSGSFPVGVAVVIGVMMFISLITLVSPAYAFGFFGILSTIFAVFILALSPAVWYSNLFIGLFIIIGIFQFLNYVQTSRGSGII